MRGSQYTFKTGRSSAVSCSPKQVSRCKDDNPESGASRSLDYDLELMLGQAIEQLKLSSRTTLELTNQIQENEITVVGTFQAMLNATQILNSFSQILYRETQSLLLYRTFRSLYESFSHCSAILHKVTSRDQNFNHAKAQYIAEQTRLLTGVGRRNAQAPIDNKIEVIRQENQRLREALVKYESTSKKMVEPQKARELQVAQRSQLTNRIAELEQQLAQNNLDFSEQIKMYNELLNQQELQISKYKYDLVEGGQDALIVRLRAEISRFKDHIFKDQLLIESMTRKIKMLERDHLFKEPVVQRALLIAMNGSRVHSTQLKTQERLMAHMETGDT